MSKGTRTKAEIVRRALEVASREGLEGLTIGGLAEVVGMSKGGLFAHFRSKEALQEQVIAAAVARFREDVVEPVLTAAPGRARLTALLKRWIAWDGNLRTPGGCPFVGFSAELDHQPGPARDAVVAVHARWMDFLARLAREGVEAGDLRDGTDARLFAFQYHGIVLSYHEAHHLAGDRQAAARARAALASLLGAYAPAR